MYEQILKSYLISGFVGVCGAFGFILTVLFSSPARSGAIALLYTLVFIAVFGFVMLVEIFARKKFVVNNFHKLLKAAVRQSVFISVLVVSLLYLQAAGLLLWWVGLTIVLFFMCLDIVCTI